MKIINNEKIHLKIDEHNSDLLIKGNVSAKKANEYIEELKKEFKTINLKPKDFNEFLYLYKYIENIISACLELKAINCSTYTYGRAKNNVYTLLKDSLRMKENTLHYEMDDSVLSEKEKDYLALHHREQSRYLNINQEYFLNNANRSLKEMEEIYSSVDKEFLSSQYVEDRLIKKLHSIYRDTYSKAKAKLQTAIDLKNEAGDDLVNWTTHKVSRRLNKLKMNHYQVHNLISEFQEEMKKEGVKKATKKNSSKKKKEDLEKKFKDEKELSQKDLIYLFKNSNKTCYYHIINKLNSDSCEELIFSKLKGVKNIIKSNRLESNLMNKINVNKESYKKALNYALENDYHFSIMFLNKFYSFTSREDLLSNNYFTQLDSSLISEEALEHIYNMHTKQERKEQLHFHTCFIEFNDKEENVELFQDFVDNKISINRKEFLLLSSYFSTEEIDNYLSFVKDPDFQNKNRDSIQEKMNDRADWILFNEKWVQETKDKEILFKLLKNETYYSDIKKKILTETPLDILKEKGFTKLEILDLLESIKFSEWESLDKYISYFELKDTLIDNIDEYKSIALRKSLFNLLSKDEILNLFKYNIGLTISLNEISEELLEDKDILISMLNNFNIKEFYQFNDYSHNQSWHLKLKEHTNKLTREELLNLDWFDFRSIEGFKEQLCITSNFIIYFFTNSITNKEWHTFLSNTNREQKLFNTNIFFSIYREIPKTAFKTFFREFNDVNSMKKHFGDIRSRKNKAAFNYMKEIFEDDSIETNLIEALGLKITPNTDIYQFSKVAEKEEHNISSRYSYSYKRIDPNLIMNRLFKKKQEHIISVKEIYKFIKFNNLENKIEKVKFLSMLEKEDRTETYNFLKLDEDSILSRHYDPMLKSCKLNKDQLNYIINPVFLNLIDDLEEYKDINLFLEKYNIKGKKLKKVILKKVLGEELSIFPIIKYHLLKSFSFKYDEIINELEKENKLIDDWIFKMLSLTFFQSSIEDGFNSLFKNKLFFRKTYKQFYKMMNFEKEFFRQDQTASLRLLNDTLDMMKDYPSLKDRINRKEKRSIRYYHDLFTSLIKKEKNPNFKFNKSHLINSKKFNKLVKENLPHYKIVLTRTKNELVNHSVELGHCVGTARYDIAVKQGYDLIFGVKENNNLKYTIQYSLKMKKIVQTQGKSRTYFDKKEEKILEDIIQKSIK